MQERAQHIAADQVRSLPVAGGEAVFQPAPHGASMHTAAARGFLDHIEPVDLDALWIDDAPLALPHGWIAGGRLVWLLRLAATLSAIHPSTSDASQATDFSESRMEAGNLPSAISR